MAKRRTTGSGSPPAAPAAPPLVETNGPLAIQLLEARYAEIAKLDPNAAGEPSFDRAGANLLADVARVFGEGSPEHTEIWQNVPIINEPTYLNPYSNFEGFPGRAKAAIARMLDRVRALIGRANELAVLHDNQRGGEAMLEDAHEPFRLIQSSGEESEVQGIWHRDKVTVFDRYFRGGSGDTITRKPPNGNVERYEILQVDYRRGFGTIPEHYEVKLRRVSSLSTPAAPAPVVNHNHGPTYNIQGSTVGAVGENATVASSHVIGKATQQTWNEIERSQAGDELKKLRSGLAAQLDDDEDGEVSTDLGHVGEATKQLKAGNHSGFLAAMKKIGQKGWAVAENLALEYLKLQMRSHMGLPPGSGEHGG